MLDFNGLEAVGKTIKALNELADIGVVVESPLMATVVYENDDFVVVELDFDRNNNYWGFSRIDDEGTLE